MQTAPTIIETTPVVEDPTSLAEPANVAVAAPRVIGRISFWLATGWLGLITLCALAADLLPLAAYDRIVSDVAPRTPPRFSLHEPLGTDSLGRSVLSRLIHGGRQSLLVGVCSVAIAMTVGIVIGMTAGYFRRGIDMAISVVLDAMLSIPALVLLIAVASVGKRDLSTVVVGLSLVGIPTFARLARATTLTLKNREYILAARAMAATERRILGRELLPHVAVSLMSFAFIWMGIAIVAEGSLSFLGLGIPSPSPSWGGMVNDARPSLGTEPFLVYVPAMCLVLTVVAFTVVGDTARRRFDRV